MSVRAKCLRVTFGSPHNRSIVIEKIDATHSAVSMINYGAGEF